MGKMSIKDRHPSRKQISTPEKILKPWDLKAKGRQNKKSKQKKAEGKSEEGASCSATRDGEGLPPQAVGQKVWRENRSWPGEGSKEGRDCWRAPGRLEARWGNRGGGNVLEGGGGHPVGLLVCTRPEGTRDWFCTVVALFTVSRVGEEGKPGRSSGGVKPEK